MKLSLFFPKLKTMVINAGRRFPEAVICQLLAFIIMSVMIFMRDDFSSETIKRLSYTMPALMGAWLSGVTLRLLAEDKTWLALRKSLIGAVTGLVAVILFYLFYHYNVSYAFSAEDQHLLLGTAGFYSSLIFLSLFVMARQIEPAPIFPVAKFAVIKTFVACMVLAMMLAICVAAFFHLLLSDNYVWEAETAYYMIGNFVYILLSGHLLLSFLPSQNSPQPIPVTIERFLARIMFPSYLILLTVLYAYVGKIAIIQTMPVGTMNWFASLAVLDFFIFYACLHGLSRYPRVALFLKWGLPIFTPIIIVQLIGVWIRFDAYGLTTPRYTSLVFIACGIFCLFLAFRRKTPQSLYLMLAVFSLIFTMTPLNIIDVPIREQEYRLQRLLVANNMLVDGKFVPNNDVSEDIRVAIHSAASYAGEASTLAQEVLFNNDMIWFPYADIQRKHYRNIYFSNPNEKIIPIKGYSHAIPINVYKNISENVLTVTDADGNERKIDLTPYVASLKETYPAVFENNDNRVSAELSFVVDDNTKIFFTVIALELYQDKVNWTNATGYVLLK